MKVELSIRDDRELRNHIKDVIKGEVTSIARGEIQNIIKDVFTSKYEKSIERSADRLIKEELKMMIKDSLKVAGAWGNTTNYIKDVARKEIEKYIKEFMNNRKIVE